MTAVADAERWVADRGLLGPGPVAGGLLAGGVSCDVVAVTGPAGALVVKHAGPYLRVAEEWAAAPRRVVHEGDVLRALAALTPDEVPALLAEDRDGHRIALARAPVAWTTWKVPLLEGRADTAVAARLGRTVGTWHAATWHREEYRALDDRELFEQLRLVPYLVTCQARRPEHADALQRVLDRLRGRRDCLVHGDFSPKNVLVGEGGLWVLDHEVAHIGDPQFDLAFMLSHLVLKAVHRPDRAAAYRACGEAFLGAYAGAAPGAGAVDGPELCALTGALLLARVHGKSPAEYLDGAGRARVSGLADQVLSAPVEELPALWRTVDEGERV